MESSCPIPKRPRVCSTSSLQHADYTVAWISALPLELTAAEAMLDIIHQPLPQDPQDSNCYTLGSINGHNVVMACLPKGQYGTNNAATVASHITRSFLNIRYRLMVGIGGGAPGNVDVRLGDVVVSTEVLQYDLCKALPYDQFERIACPVRPSQSLMTAVSKLQASQARHGSQFSTILLDIAVRLPAYSRPKQPDRLFLSDYNHPENLKTCDDCDQTKLSPRDARPRTDPLIHFGRIASGNQVIKDAHTRDKLSKELNCICFEMEAAGLMDASSFLAIRGICDYSDSHKNKEWQEYAALTAAAYAKDLLSTIPAHDSIPIKRRKFQDPEVPDVIDPEVTKFLRALFVTDPVQDREDILDAKGQICQGTCDWVLFTDEFQTWDQNPPHLLWVSAPPGVGKTFLSIYLSKHFEAVAVKQPDTAAICFFCDNKIEARNSAVNIMRGLLHQLASLERDLAMLLKPVWDQRSSQLFESTSFGILWRLFEMVIDKSSFRTIYCVIDALDECEHNSLSLLLTKFEQLSDSASRSPKKVKMVCLSRRFPERIPESLDLFTRIELDIMEAGKADVERFITQRVSTLGRKKKFSSKMATCVEEVFRSKSEGTFLWVSYMAQDLEHKSLLEIESSLNSLPAGLDAIYDRVLSQIDIDKRDTIDRMLDWILVVSRPLRIPELCAAAGIQATKLLTSEEVCFELIKSCGHLLQVSQSESLFKCFQESHLVMKWCCCKGSCTRRHIERARLNKQFWSLSVTFLHQSAKDYFKKRKSPGAIETATTTLSRLHESLANQLLQYFHHISRHPRLDLGQLYDLIIDLPLTFYAASSWQYHFREINDIGPIMFQNSGFFSQLSETRRAYGKIMHEIDWGFPDHLLDNWRVEDAWGCSKVHALNMSCILDLPNLARWCLESEDAKDIDMCCEHLEFALHFAIDLNSESIVKVLLDADADMLEMDEYGHTALEKAMENSSIDILRRISRQDEWKQCITEEALNPETKLMRAAMGNRNNEEACRLLIEEFAWDVNFPDDKQPIYYAIAEGHLELVHSLVSEWHADIDSWKALEAISYNASWSEDQIRTLLQDLSVDINATHRKGYNACVLSSRKTYLQALLQLGCNPNQPDLEGRTPLHHYAMRSWPLYFNDFLDMAGVLISHEEVQVNQVCHRGWTVLHYLMQTFKRMLSNCRYDDGRLGKVSESLIILLDKGADRHIVSVKGLSALQILKSCISPDDRWWLKYVDRAVTVLQDYCTAPAGPGKLRSQLGTGCLKWV